MVIQCVYTGASVLCKKCLNYLFFAIYLFKLRYINMKDLKLYDIIIKPLAEKDLKSINKSDSIKILNRIIDLENGLKGDIKKLTNFNPEYRLRIENFRVLFEIENKKLIIYRVLHRKESYK
jgi:mRNA interferase RelE/StbE